MIDRAPGKYFISHSYKNAVVRYNMIKQLLDYVEPYIFLPINVSPKEFVSRTWFTSDDF